MPYAPRNKYEKGGIPNEARKYLYGIINAGKGSFGKIGLGGNEVYTIPYRDISVAVSDLSSTPVESSAENYLTHEGVIRHLMQQHTVLPIKFLSVMKNREDIKSMLSELYAECKLELKKFENKVELGVKVFFDGQKVKREFDNMHGEIEKLRKNLLLRIKTRSLGEAVRRQLDYTEEGESREKDEYAVKIFYAEKFHEMLKKYAVDARANELIDNDMVLNGAYLVWKDKVEEFQKELDKIKKEHESRGFEFLLSGPWALYNFTKIRYY